MHTIQVTLPVFKALTNRLIGEDQTFDDVLRELLKLDSEIVPEGDVDTPLGKLATALRPHVEAMARLQHGKGFISRNLYLPEGTELRARYKGKLYRALIRGEDWVDADGRVQRSPSSAATAITETTLNGLRFWEAKRPNDEIWRRLDKLL